MIRLEQVKYQYDELHFNFDLTVNRGECAAVFGRSGEGKSTLLNIIAGFIKPLSGDIYLDGKNVNRAAIERRPLSILFQNNNLFEHLSVQRNLAFGLTTRLRLKPVELEQVAEMAEKLEIGSQLSKMPDQLSGGQRQRVALGRCLLRDQPILLLDEPFSGLDVISKNKAMDLLQQLQVDNGLTMVLVTHDEQEAIIASKRYFLKDGVLETR